MVWRCIAAGSSLTQVRIITEELPEWVQNWYHWCFTRTTAVTSRGTSTDSKSVSILLLCSLPDLPTSVYLPADPNPHLQ